MLASSSAAESLSLPLLSSSTMTTTQLAEIQVITFDNPVRMVTCAQSVIKDSLAAAESLAAVSSRPRSFFGRGFSISPRGHRVASRRRVGVHGAPQKQLLSPASIIRIGPFKVTRLATHIAVKSKSGNARYGIPPASRRLKRKQQQQQQQNTIQKV